MTYSNKKTERLVQNICFLYKYRRELRSFDSEKKSMNLFMLTEIVSHVDIIILYVNTINAACRHK